MNKFTLLLIYARFGLDNVDILIPVKDLTAVAISGNNLSIIISMDAMMNEKYMNLENDISMDLKEGIINNASVNIIP